MVFQVLFEKKPEIPEYIQVWLSISGFFSTKPEYIQVFQVFVKSQPSASRGSHLSRWLGFAKKPEIPEETNGFSGFV